MNKFLKIFLLAFALLAVSGITLVFLKTVLDPPSRIEDWNPFEKNLEEETALLQASSSPTERDSLYVLMMDETDIQFKESLLDTTLRDQLLKGFLSVYSPMFKEECDAFFSAAWTLSDYDKRSERLKEIKSCVSVREHTPCYPEGVISALDETFETVNKARRCAGKSHRFESTSQARQDISNASRYKNQYPVSNCPELKRRLERVAPSLEKDHYNQIKSLVEKLSAYERHYQSMSAFSQDMNKADNLISAYGEVSYPGARSMDEFSSSVYTSYRAAYDHF